jgi:pimeloyl-ACP methyl ester carboxylesterase
MGGSDPVRCPSFESWACDLAACADALRLGRFGLTGTSAGTPFLLAAALRLGDRVTAVSVGSPAAEITPGHRLDPGAGPRGWRVAAAAPLIAAAGLKAMKRQVERCPRSLVRFAQPLTPDEERGFDDPDNLRLAAAVFTEAMRNGAMGVVNELQLLARPWGLPLADVRVAVSIFHGGLDRRAPPWMAEELAARLPTAIRYRTPTDGHLSMPKNMGRELLDAAIGDHART